MVVSLRNPSLNLFPLCFCGVGETSNASARFLARKRNLPSAARTHGTPHPHTVRPHAACCSSSSASKVTHQLQCVIATHTFDDIYASPKEQLPLLTLHTIILASGVRRYTLQLLLHSDLSPSLLLQQIAHCQNLLIQQRPSFKLLLQEDMTKRDYPVQIFTANIAQPIYKNGIQSTLHKTHLLPSKILCPLFLLTFL